MWSGPWGHAHFPVLRQRCSAFPVSAHVGAALRVGCSSPLPEHLGQWHCCEAQTGGRPAPVVPQRMQATKGKVAALGAAWSRAKM